MEMATTFNYLDTSLRNLLVIPLLYCDVKFPIATWIGNVNTRPYRVLFYFFSFFFNLDTFLQNSCTQRFRLLWQLGQSGTTLTKEFHIFIAAAEVVARISFSPVHTWATKILCTIFRSFNSSVLLSETDFQVKYGTTVLTPTHLFMALARVVWVSYEMDPKLIAPNKINIGKLLSKLKFSFVAIHFPQK